MSASDVKYQWYHADFDSLLVYFDAIDWMTTVYHNPSAQNMWTFFVNTLNDAIRLFVPSYKLCGNSVTRNSKPRVSKPLRKSASKKLRLWKKLRSSPDDVSLHFRYHSCVLEWRELINNTQATAEAKIIDANNLGAFYRFVNRRIGNRLSIGVIVDGNSCVVTDCRKGKFV